MPTLQTLMDDLKARGAEKTRVTYARHGIPLERTFGVSVADLKVIEKTIKRQQDLAYELYGTGMMDAMYLAGLVADGAQMTRKQLESWAEGSANMPMIQDYIVPWVTIENPEARDLATEWIKSKKEHLICCGWCTYAGLVATRPDTTLDLPEIEELLTIAVREIPKASDRVRLKMNSFVIAIGTYVKPLLTQAKASAHQIGRISADMGDTACKVPQATEYIAKVEAANRVGQKRKTIRC